MVSYQDFGLYCRALKAGTFRALNPNQSLPNVSEVKCFPFSSIRVVEGSWSPKFSLYALGLLTCTQDVAKYVHKNFFLSKSHIQCI